MSSVCKLILVRKLFLCTVQPYDRKLFDWCKQHVFDKLILVAVELEQSVDHMVRKHLMMDTVALFVNLEMCSIVDCSFFQDGEGEKKYLD